MKIFWPHQSASGPPNKGIGWVFFLVFVLMGLWGFAKFQVVGLPMWTSILALVFATLCGIITVCTDLLID
jgi:uncharacterized membrane protein